jgi:hypothetical protein
LAVLHCFLDAPLLPLLPLHLLLLFYSPEKNHLPKKFVTSEVEGEKIIKVVRVICICFFLPHPNIFYIILLPREHAFKG